MVSIENAEKLIGRVYKLTDDAKKEGRNLSEGEKKPLLAEIEKAKNEINSGQGNIKRTAPQGTSESVTKMIDEIMSDLQRSHQNLERRAIELRK
jgi:hypothetical protein